MSESREEIVKTAEDLFLTYGVRSVTMDDISRKLAISKKTIYQHYKDKDEIVCRVTKRVLKREKEMISATKEQAHNAIHELVMISRYLKEHAQTINPSVLFDLQKYHREAWCIYLKFKEIVFLQAIRETLQRGIQEGYFRKDIDVEVLSILRIEEIQLTFDNQVFPRDQFDNREVQLQLFEHFIRGIVTPEGIALIHQYNEHTP